MMRSVMILSLLTILLGLVAPFVWASDLPDDDSVENQLIVVCRPEDAPARWFQEVPELRQVRNSVAFTQFTPTSKLFRERYETILGTNFPIVAYMRPDGGVIYYADRNTLPSSGDSLSLAIKTAIAQATNAVPASNGQKESEITYANQDECVDGSCTPDTKLDPSVRFPKLRPLKQPPANPLDQVVSGWFRESISTGIWLVFSVIALGFVLFFFVLLIGAMLVVRMLWR